MTDTPQVGGEIITYLDTSDPEQGEFRQAVTTGAGVVDPETGEVWMSLVRGNHELALVDPAFVVETVHSRNERSQAVVDVLAGALAVLVFDLTQLDDRSPTALKNARELLRRFDKAIAPIEQVLRELVEADPEGALATVVGCLSSAAEQFTRGRLADGRAAVLVAQATMSKLAEPGPAESS